MREEPTTIKPQIETTPHDTLVPTKNNDTLTTRREILAIATSVAAAIFMGIPDAIAERPESVEQYRSGMFTPINLRSPGLNIVSQELDLEKLPPKIKRIILFYTGMGCHPCEEIEEKMKTAWSTLPSDTLVIPIDLSLSEESLTEINDFANAKYMFEPPPFYEKDGETPNQTIIIMLHNYRLRLIERYIKNKSAKNRQQAEEMVNNMDIRTKLIDMLKEMRQNEIEGLNNVLEYLKRKHSLFVERGQSPGLYKEKKDETPKLRRKYGIPEVIVIRRDNGRVTHRPQSKTLLNSSSERIWRQILGR